jgi:hypothetical protein
MIKHLLRLFLLLSRVLDSTESGEDLVREAVRVVGGDTATPVVVMDLMLGSRASIGADSAPVGGKMEEKGVKREQVYVY